MAAYESARKRSRRVYKLILTEQRDHSRVRKPCASDIGEAPCPVKKWGFQGV